MKVTMVNSFFPPWRGGAETYTYNLSKALVKHGHHVTVLCGGDPLAPGTYRQDGIEIRRLRILGRLYGTPLMPSLAAELYRSDADIFHANFPSPYIGFNVAAASACRAIPAALTWHNDLPSVTTGARFLIEAHDRFVLPHYVHTYRRVISTSKTYVKRSRILTSLGGMVRVVPNGVDCERYHPEVKGGGIREYLGLARRFTLLFVGALTKWHAYKGLDILLQAQKLLVDAHLDAQLLIVGDGELKRSYNSLSQRLGVAGNVVFAGDVPDDMLPQWYAASNVLVLPSKDMSEGFGLTLLEANASGKPVIASNVGGIPSVVKSGYNGLLVPPNDAGALAKAIARLATNPREAQQMGNSGRQFAETHDWKMTAARTEQVYLEACGAEDRPTDIVS